MSQAAAVCSPLSARREWARVRAGASVDATGENALTPALSRDNGRGSVRATLAWVFVAFALIVSRSFAAAPATAPAVPPGLEGVTIDQKLGDTIPLDLPFTDETGKTVALRDYFHGRPVLLTLVYFECPMLCTVTLNQLTRSLTALSESAG